MANGSKSSKLNSERESERMHQARLYLRKIISRQTQALQEVASKFSATNNPHPIFNNAFNEVFSRRDLGGFNYFSPYHRYYYDTYIKSEHSTVPRPVELMDLYTMTCYIYFQTMFLSYYFAHPNIDPKVNIKKYIEEVYHTIIEYTTSDGEIKLKHSTFISSNNHDGKPLTKDNVIQTLRNFGLGNFADANAQSDSMLSLYEPQMFNVVKYSKDFDGNVVSKECLAGKSFRNIKKEINFNIFDKVIDNDEEVAILKSASNNSEYLARYSKTMEEVEIEKYILARIAESVNTAMGAKLSPCNPYINFSPITKSIVQAFNKGQISVDQIQQDLCENGADTYLMARDHNPYFSTNPKQRQAQWDKEDMEHNSQPKYVQAFSLIDDLNSLATPEEPKVVSKAESKTATQLKEYVEKKADKPAPKAEDMFDDDEYDNLNLSTSDYYSADTNEKLYHDQEQNLVDKDGNVYNGAVYMINDGEQEFVDNPNIDIESIMNDEPLK